MLKNQQFEKVAKLLIKYPDIINSLRDEHEQTLMMEAAYKRKDCVKFLSKIPHDISVVDDEGQNVLHYIVWYNDDDDAIELLKCLDVSQLNYNIINKQTIFQLTPLNHAATRNNHESIRWLLNHQADVSIEDVGGLRPDEQDECDEETKRIFRQY